MSTNSQLFPTSVAATPVLEGDDHVARSLSVILTIALSLAVNGRIVASLQNDKMSAIDPVVFEQDRLLANFYISVLRDYALNVLGVRSRFRDTEVLDSYNSREKRAAMVQFLRSDVEVAELLRRNPLIQGQLGDHMDVSRLRRQIRALIDRDESRTMMGLFIDTLGSTYMRWLTTTGSTQQLARDLIALDSSYERVLSEAINAAILQGIDSLQLSHDANDIRYYWRELTKPEGAVTVTLQELTVTVRSLIPSLLVATYWREQYDVSSPALYADTKRFTEAAVNSDRWRQMQELLAVLSLLLPGTQIAAMMQDDPVSLAAQLKLSSGRKRVVTAALQHFSEDPRMEVAMRRAVGIGLTSGLEASHQAQAAETVANEVRHPLILCDLRDLFVLNDSDGAQLTSSNQQQSLATYRQSCLDTLKRAVQLGYSIVAYGVYGNIPHRRTYEAISRSLPGLRLVLPPWDLTPWSEAAAMKRAADTLLTRDSGDVLLIRTLTGSNINGGQQVAAALQSVANRLGLLAFDVNEAFPVRLPQLIPLPPSNSVVLLLWASNDRNLEPPMQWLQRFYRVSQFVSLSELRSMTGGRGLVCDAVRLESDVRTLDLSAINELVSSLNRQILQSHQGGKSYFPVLVFAYRNTRSSSTRRDWLQVVQVNRNAVNLLVNVIYYESE